jgi:hypothetical protein
MVNNDIRIGPQIASDGVITTQRGARTGEACITFAHSYYQEPASRAGINEACTAVAGVAPGTALSTTPPFALWNPPNSGVNLYILKTSLGYVSGTLGAGSLLYAQVTLQTTVPSTGTELVPVNTNLGRARGQGRAFQGSTLASTPTIIRAAFTLGAFVGGANPPVPVADVIDGAFCVPPGAVFCMQGLAGAGTSPLVILGCAWEEIPV